MGQYLSYELIRQGFKNVTVMKKITRAWENDTVVIWAD